jgi:ribosome-binding protein aMBF1 (putative translation factor)
MIQNEHQYKVSKAALQKFLLAAEQYQPSSTIHPKLALAKRQALQGQIDTLKAELEVYEQLKTQGGLIDLAPLEQLASDLIKARVAKGYTQAQLAAKLKMKPQQIQRYEATHYASASLARVLEVARVLQKP